MGANIAGTELQGWAALLEKWAMQKQFQEEAARQAGYRTQALGAFGQGLPMAGSAMAAPTMADAASAREAGYAKLGAIPLSVSDPKYATSRNPAADQAYAALIGGNRARLGAYGDWQFKQGLSAQETARQLNQISNFAGGTARVFPYLMYKAQHSQDAMAAIGQALSSLGGGGGGGIGQMYTQQPQSFNAPAFQQPGVTGGIGDPYTNVPMGGAYPYGGYGYGAGLAVG